MARRYRSGGLYQRSSDNRWIGSIPDGHGGVLKYVTGTNKEDVERRMRAVPRSTTSRRAVSRELVGPYMERWLDSRTKLAPRTRDSYRSVMTHHIIPALGRIPLRDLDAMDVQDMVNAVARTHSSQTAKHSRNILSAALREAARMQLIPGNVARLAEAPTVRRKPPAPIRVDQVQTFLDAVQDDPRYPFYVLAFTTGMRRGELLALRWQDVDWTSREVDVNATLRQTGRWKFRRDPTKTERSRRRVPLSDLALQALRDHQKVATSTEFIFARPDGRPWPPAEVTREFQRRLVAAGLPKARLHDTRHTAVAILLAENGGDMFAVSRIVGHGSIQTTANTYGGLGTDQMRRAVDGMDRVLRRRNG